MLINGGFENAGEPCASGNGWTQVPGTNNCLRDGTTWGPPGAYEGQHWGGVDMGNPSASDFAIITQTVTLPGTGNVRLVGVISGNQSTGEADHFVRIHDGAAHTDAVIAEFIISSGGWDAIDIVAVPTGSQVTVSWGWDNVRPVSEWNQATASHLDGLVLTQEQPGCTGEPTIIQIIPTTFGTNDGTLDEVVVIGTNFDETSQVLLRRTGFVDVEATGESVGGGGTAITCSLPLDGVAMGKWNLVVTKDLCNEALLNNGFIVAVPTLTNGSFEDPSAPASCPNPPAPQDAPLSWLDGGIATAPDLLIRDSDQYPPSCPRPDGDHYASMMVPQGTSFAFWRTYQYIAVTPGQQVTVCGQFAGGGATEVYLRIKEGDEEGEDLAERTIENFEGCPPRQYDWVPACVSATPAGGLITVEWALGAWQNADQSSATHADHLVMTQGPPPAEVCDDGVDNDGDRATDCQDSDCAEAPGCDPAPVEICDNRIDDDGDVMIDCFDEDCAEEPVCQEICGNGVDDNGNCEVDEDCEICDNGIDDDDNGLIDCDDPDCADFPGCGEACGNGVDDDGDGDIDCLDADCDDSPLCPCSDPFADPDSDGDVDHEDFGNLQACITGPLDGDPPALPLECVCFDRDGDRDIDQVDVTQFEKCATGPMIPFDIENPPEDCIP